ncbi:L,D-transpeptidase family protein [Neisseria sp. Ec49-e6-T10]|uniref:L,D-transpeptidase family protein n=1 Tax=Neisseria sp. Ec49-e6-T10 TaxID=3140744 RepID=UPI003EBB7EBA
MKKLILGLLTLLIVAASGYFFYQYQPVPDVLPIEQTSTPVDASEPQQVDVLNNDWGQTPVDQLPRITKIKVYKAQRYMELLAKDQIVRRYAIRLGFAPEGHKKEEGDGKTPEGNYIIDWRNPNSSYYKSLHVSYPNQADTKQAQDRGVSAGGDIMIHGTINTKQGKEGEPLYRYMPNRDWTFGCIAVSNAVMDELWILIKNNTPIEIVP